MRKAPYPKNIRPGLYLKAAYVAPKNTFWERHEKFLAQFTERIELQMAKDLVRQQEIEVRLQTKLEQPYYISERDSRIVEMRMDKEMTLGEIGTVEGISRERVRQILSRIEKIAHVRFPRSFRRLVYVPIKCQVCDVMGELPESWINNGRTFRCQEHKRKHSKMVALIPNWYELDDNAQERARYRLDPGRRERSRMHARKWRAKVLKDPEKKAHYLELQKAAVVRHLAKKRLDPDWVEKQRKQSAENYQKNRLKPGWLEVEAGRQRMRCVHDRAKKAAAIEEARKKLEPYKGLFE